MTLKPHLLTLVLLVKNESQSIDAIIRSCSSAIDSVDMLDTGSSDGTIRIARETCAALKLPLRVYEEPFVDFATSRNRALTYAEPHAIFGMMLSGDEQVVGVEHVRRLCESESEKQGKNHNCFMIDVDYDSMTDKSLRILRLGSDWTWVGETHEFLSSETDSAGVAISRDHARILHDVRDSENRLSRKYLDLEILARKHGEDPKDSRTVFYLARTLHGLGLCADAMRFYLSRAEMEGWPEEVYVSLYQAGRCAYTIGRPWSEVQDLLLRATQARPSRAEALMLLAEYCWKRKENALTFMYAMRAASIRFPLYDGLSVLRDVYEWRALNLMHLAGFDIGELDAGLEAARALTAKFPEEKGFEKNAKIYAALIEERLGKPLDLSFLESL